MQSEWHANKTLVLAGITVYSCCFSIAPPIFAPISETIGRRPIYVFNCILFTATMFLVGFAQVPRKSLF
jgi:MFS family permease